MIARIEPARIELFDTGLRSPLFDDLYHSGSGALNQARHVFLGGNGLPERFARAERFCILETGFGLGLNFLATVQAWRRYAPADARLDYFAVEKHPLRAGDLAQVLSRFPDCAADAEELVARWPWLMSGVYRLEFAAGRVALTLVFADVLEGLGEFEAEADAVYLDGFAPSKNPAMWSPEVFAQIARLTRPGATLATYTVAAGVRDALTSAGFAVEKRAGLPPKRSMLVARAPGTWAARLPEGGETLVIGCGYAGALVAERLVRHGQQVRLLERRSGPAQEISGNPAGLLLPALNPSDTASAQLSRAALSFALQRVQEGLGAVAKGAWGACGVLQIAALDEEFDKMRDLIATLGVPPELARLVDAAEAACLAGGPVPRGGLWYERGAWIHPAAVVEAALRSAGEALRLRYDTSVARLVREGNEWCALDGQGACLARASRVVLAPGNGLAAFAQAEGIRLITARGQLSYLPQATRALPVAVCGDGYAVPLPAGGVLLGTTFDRDEDPNLRVSDHEKNLRRVAALLPGLVPEVEANTLSGRVGFRATSPDRLPYVGELPRWHTQGPQIEREPGLYVLAGLGARGLVWAPLAAELIACQIARDPLPVAKSIVAAIDPARVLLRRKARRGAL
ncbi:tRNA 5-methylaminomethyl-2-thiouridine biosynthesis bifunctional protein MnmC [Burkholderiales bacterium]|nr:MAG: bifunctional tRNA (5-methylaminomethyl-2-thiouridine)(34)-methyltransferase MnmD/FAD-dependent 5-carboxymethylaminomethyl-2-thiouridine(34) oxidoreductase MnmC [Burkholderiales bacterium]CAG0970732.1 tRNA 5-methylaminomethyl-2-thiouridine biosynthesis bifunctional protein MnmC [Burkholderiales bacterium]